MEELEAVPHRRLVYVTVRISGCPHLQRLDATAIKTTKVFTMPDRWDAMVSSLV
jgi:hypothetical protein